MGMGRKGWLPHARMSLLVQSWNTYEVYTKKTRSPPRSSNFGITVEDFKFLSDEQSDLSNQRKCPCPGHRYPPRRKE